MFVKHAIYPLTIKSIKTILLNECDDLLTFAALISLLHFYICINIMLNYIFCTSFDDLKFDKKVFSQIILWKS